MNKNIGPFLAFNKEWFEKNQRILLWLLNNRLTKRWARWILRIRKHDVGYDKIIIAILPNCYTVFEKFVGDKVLLTTDFRTHSKYAKRIYYAFRPLWWAIHAWDSVFADRFVPQWSYGFSTLTVYPAAGANDPVDGVVSRAGVNEVFSALRGGAGNAAYPTTANYLAAYIEATSTTNQYAEIDRSIYLFNTSPITDTGSVTAATFSIYGNNKYASGLTAQDISLTSSAPAADNNLVNGDYSNLGTTRFANDIAYADFSTAGYNDFTFNAAGLAAVNKTGNTKLGCRLKCDIDNSAPAWASGGFTGYRSYFADQAGTTNDPKLVVTYSTSSIKTWNGLARSSIKTINGLAISSIKSINGLT